MLGGVIYSQFPWHDFACKCCGVILVSPKLIGRYSRLIELVTPSTIRIHSGYRCPKHNAEVGGSPWSRHMRGEALDFHIEGMTLADMYEICRQEFYGVGRYPRWNNPGLHCDVRDERKEWTWTN